MTKYFNSTLALIRLRESLTDIENEFMLKNKKL